ncbi:MAG: NADH-quinone oxidoreductase subunit N [Rickettsiaceae bacterium H1]|nr:NADH-quinone oxidoreductase subunit N [Rickettsiaceae bacterium H1]
MNNLTYIIPEIFLTLSSLFLLLVNKEKSLIVIFSVIVSLILVCLTWCSHSNLIFNGFIAISPFTQILKVIVLALVAITLLIMRSGNSYTNDLPILVTFSTLGMMSLISSHDLLTLYMAVELQSLPMYVMAAIDRKSLKSSEAGVKYFILGALASGVLLYGISMLYGFTGSTNFAGLTKVFRSGDLELGVLIGSILIISALAFKVGAAPFHMWVPDVYQGAPTVITAFFAIVPKVSLIGLFIRLLDYELVNIKLQQVLILIAMLSLVVSAFGALKQTNIKRLFAYSSIGHVGYILIGIAAGIQLQEAVTDIVTYVVIYSLMNLGLFSFVISISHYEIAKLSEMYRKYPLISVCLVVLLLSMAGIPPTAGFFTKIYILSGVVKAGLWWLALFALFTSVVSAYYYLRIVKVIYFDRQVGSGLIVTPDNTLSSITVVMAIINITFFLYSGYWFGVLSKAVNYL